MAESTTQTAGAEARVNEQALAAAREEAVQAGAGAHRRNRTRAPLASNRFSEIDFVRKAISDGKTADQFSVEGRSRR